LNWAIFTDSTFGMSTHLSLLANIFCITKHKRTCAILLFIFILIASRDIKAQTTLNLKFFIEGYYLSGGMMQQVLYYEGVDPNPFSTSTDTAVVELHDSIYPCSGIMIYKGVFMTDGTMRCIFPASVAGHSFYIAVRHRNSILTWSASPVVFTSSTIYDFSTGCNKAYANNMVQVEPNVWAFYSGDINQDYNIDLVDVPILDSGIMHGLWGYYASDINGDGNVDLVDFPVLDNNIPLGVFSMNPPFAHFLPSDINQDGTVDINDFDLFIGTFNSVCSCPEDINADGVMNIDDYLILLGDFGKTCH